MRETPRVCADYDGILVVMLVVVNVVRLILVDVANVQLLAQESTMRATAEAAKLRRQQVCAGVWIWAGVGRGWWVRLYVVCLCNRNYNRLCCVYMLMDVCTHANRRQSKSWSANAPPRPVWRNWIAVR